MWVDRGFWRGRYHGGGSEVYLYSAAGEMDEQISRFGFSIVVLSWCGWWSYSKKMMFCV